MEFKELRQNRIPHVIWKIRAGSGFIWKPYKQKLACWEWLSAVEYRQYVDTCRAHSVHDSIRRLDHLANLRMLEFGHYSTRIRESSNLLRAVGQTIDNA